jgi:hypothetical protein
MKRIIAILKELIEDQKLNNKVKRVENAIQAASLNAETELMEIQDKKIKAVESLKDKDTEDVLGELVSLVEKEKEIQEATDNLAIVKNYLFETVEAVKKDK